MSARCTSFVLGRLRTESPATSTNVLAQPFTAFVVVDGEAMQLLLSTCLVAVGGLSEGEDETRILTGARK